jgi:hypothetical protein
MNSQSPETLTRDSFGTLPWESREKDPFECSFHRELQRILYGGRWWLPPSPGRGESSESKSCRKYYMGEGDGFPRVQVVVSQVSPSARGLSQHPRVLSNVN